MFISKVIFKTLFAVAVLGQNAIVFAVSDDHNIPSSKLANNDGSPTTALRGSVVAQEVSEGANSSSKGHELLQAVMNKKASPLEEEDSDNSNNSNGSSRQLQEATQLMYCGYDDKFKWKYTDKTQVTDEWGTYMTEINWYGCNPGIWGGKRWVCTTNGHVTMGDPCDNGGNWKQCCL